MTAITEPQIVQSHIAIGKDGQARIAGTGYKVRLLVGEHRSHGCTAEQIQQSHPDLTLAQAHSVLAYYYDHKTEMDADMDRREKMVEQRRLEAGEPPLVARLKSEGRWPYPFSLTDEQLLAEEESNDR